MPALALLVAMPLLAGLAAPALAGPRLTDGGPGVGCPDPGAYISVRDGRATVSVDVPEGCDQLTLTAYAHTDSDDDGEADLASLTDRANLPAGERTSASVNLPGHGCAASAWLVTGAVTEGFDLPGNPYGDRALDSALVDLDACEPPATTTTTTTAPTTTTTTLPPVPGTKPPGGQPARTTTTIGTPNTVVKVTVKAGTTTSSSTTSSSTTSSTTTSTTIDESLPYDDSQGGVGGSAQDPPKASPPSGGSAPVDVRPLLIGAIVAVSALIVLILVARGVRGWHDRRLSAAGID
jgi:hypothetical protein